MVKWLVFVVRQTILNGRIITTLNLILSPHWRLTWDSIAPARTQCIAAFESERKGHFE